MECELPGPRPDLKTMKAIFDQVKTIAVVGLSPDESKASNMVARYLQNQGYRVIPVYPKEETILGEKVYASLAEIPEPIDMVDVFRKPDAMPAIAEAAAARGDAKVFWMQQGLASSAARKIAEAAGMTVVEGLCAKVEHQNL